jgi:predicted SnoaL-like aldol condensation-catalyzing enzyme
MINRMIKQIPTERRKNNTQMAVVRSNYVKKGKTEKARAKATVRYIQHRPGKDNKKPSGLYSVDMDALKGRMPIK